MFDMGFYPDLRKLIKVVPPVDHRQTMLFSATLNAWVKNLAWEYTKSPFEIEIEPETVTVDEVEQVLYHVPSDDKMKLLMGIMRQEQPESAVIFCNTKRYAEVVAKRLRVNGFECEFLMGDLPQSRRLKIIDDVKAGVVRYLVATDVAARGLDIEGLSLVVNYDLPSEAENYVHRIGRTARAGKTGKAITIASEQDVYILPVIERYIGKPIPSEVVGADRYGEDKSEGMHIHTDFYDDRGADRGRSSDRTQSRRGEDRGAREPRPSERRSSERRFSDEGRRPGRARNIVEGDASGEQSASEGERRSPEQERRGNPRRGAGKRDAGGRTGRSTQSVNFTSADLVTGVPDDVELTHLSFDERMAYYKQKYAASADAAEHRAASPGKRPPRKKSQDRTDAPDATTAQRDDKRQTAPANQSTRPAKGKGMPAPSQPDTQGGRGSSPDTARRKGTPSTGTGRRTDQRKGISGKEIADGKPAGAKPPKRTPENPEQHADSPASRGIASDGAASHGTASDGGKASKGILSRIFSLFKK
jgi:ATP-dependent RNA helicase RhlB